MHQETKSSVVTMKPCHEMYLAVPADFCWDPVVEAALHGVEDFPVMSVVTPTCTCSGLNQNTAPLCETSVMKNPKSK